ncbi:MAG: DUF1801 domain-containing protein [Anaerolineaceae bacterium]|nr:DUF1801 domain-containing protein [Anaerolineaceae bacterium]
MKNKIPKDVDEYIAGFPEEIQVILEKIRTVIREAVPEAEEKISYRMPTYAWKGNLVHFAAHSKHIGFYPAPSGIRRFEDEISSYRYSKGAVQFPLDQPIPYDLIRRITVFRAEENLQKNGDRAR